MLEENRLQADICNITAWHNEGILGKGVNVAIFDTKFNTQSENAQKIFNGKIHGRLGFDDPDKRTRLPIRFVAENMGYEVEWDEGERKVTLIKK